MKSFLYFIFLLTSFYPLMAQSKINNSSNHVIKNDTSKYLKITPRIENQRNRPLYELTSKISSNLLSTYKSNFADIIEPSLYQYSKEELASGLSYSELASYRYNKDLLHSILQKKYDESWWLKVKSVGQLIGIPDFFIKLILYSLLLF